MKFDTRYTPESNARKDNEKLDEGPLLAVSCLSHQRFLSRLNDRFRAKLPPTDTKNDRIDYLGLSNSQINRNRRSKGAASLLEPHG